MFKIMLALHLLTAIFAIGPLVGAATTASRGLRKADASATGNAARTLTVYGYASLVVVIFGFGLMSAKPDYGNKEHVAEFSEPWIWISVVLWLCSLALIFGLVVPALKQATTALAGAPGETTSVGSLTGRVAAGGGLIALVYVAIIVLMVYQPGS